LVGGLSCDALEVESWELNRKLATRKEFTMWRSRKTQVLLSLLGATVLAACLFAAKTSIGRSESTARDTMLPQSARLTELPLTAVEIQDNFWSPRQEAGRTRTLDHVYAELDETGCLRNFDIAAGKVQGKFGGPWWADSDVYKWIEGASYTLALHPDPKLAARVDDLIARIAAAQQKDGYIDTFIQLAEPDMRWRNLAFFHELFCAGSLYEAAVAHHLATGKRTLLDIALKNADYVDSTFGPGKKDGIPGHEEVELALVKLYRLTGEKRYLRLAEYFVNSRGEKPSIFERQYEQLPSPMTVELLGRKMDVKDFYKRFFLIDPSKFNTSYSQDNQPVRQQSDAVGHAVRAMYLYSGMADLAYETSDQGLFDALLRLHDSVTLRRMYVTGGIGPSEHNEGFTADYDLPNDNAYQETCASQGMVLWNYRMLKLTGDARFADVMELSLYNALAAGVSLSGDLFCYVTPLASGGDFKRDPWFGVPCCPTTIARFIPSLGKYIYNQSADGLWVNLYISGKVNAQLPGGNVTLTQSSDYPWEGNVKLQVTAEKPQEFTLCLRVPGWCAKPEFKVNGEPLTPTISRGYAELRRTWSSGDTVDLTLPMEIQRLEANPNVLYDRGKRALRRGPLIFCLEAADQEAPLDRIVLPPDAPLSDHFEQALFGGTMQIWGEAEERESEGWENQLYRPASAPKGKTIHIKAVPYAIWGNRGLGKMVVWIDSTF
jgi:hypothetical protein